MSTMALCTLSESRHLKNDVQFDEHEKINAVGKRFKCADDMFEFLDTEKDATHCEKKTQQKWFNIVLFIENRYFGVHYAI